MMLYADEKNHRPKRSVFKLLMKNITRASCNACVYHKGVPSDSVDPKLVKSLICDTVTLVSCESKKGKQTGTVYCVLCQGYCQILVVGVLQRPTGKEGRLQQVCVFFFFFIQSHDSAKMNPEDVSAAVKVGNSRSSFTQNSF